MTQKMSGEWSFNQLWNYLSCVPGINIVWSSMGLSMSTC